MNNRELGITVRELKREVKRIEKALIKKWLMEYSFMSDEDKQKYFEKYKKQKIKLASLS